jgi:hypothetical protein
MNLDTIYTVVGKIVVWSGIVSMVAMILLIGSLAVALIGGDYIARYFKAKNLRCPTPPEPIDPESCPTAKMSAIPKDSAS